MATFYDFSYTREMPEELQQQLQEHPVIRDEIQAYGEPQLIFHIGRLSVNEVSTHVLQEVFDAENNRGYIYADDVEVIEKRLNSFANWGESYTDAITETRAALATVKAALAFTQSVAVDYPA